MCWAKCVLMAMLSQKMRGQSDYFRAGGNIRADRGFPLSMARRKIELLMQGGHFDLGVFQ